MNRVLQSVHTQGSMYDMNRLSLSSSAFSICLKPFRTKTIADSQLRPDREVDRRNGLKSIEALTRNSELHCPSGTSITFRVHTQHPAEAFHG